MLAGKRVCLTEIREQDNQSLYEWINLSETVHYNSPWKPVTYSAHSKWFECIGADETRFVLAIRGVETDNPSIIGVIQLLNVSPVHRSAELTIRIGRPEDRGCGYGVEALMLAIEFAWRDLNLQRLWLRVFSSNQRAIKAYLKAGFVSEGVMKRSAWISGQWQDEEIMAILR